MHALAQAERLAHPVPDRHGANFYATDPELQSLLALYLPADLLAHLQPYLQRMGELAGGRIDELAGIADRNPPTLEHRSRAGQDSQRIIKHPAYEELERIAYGEFGLQAISHRDDMLGWSGKMPPIVKYALTFLFVQSEFGLCCPLSMTDSLTRTLKKYGPRAGGQVFASAALAGLGKPGPGRDVHDRAGRRLGHRQHADWPPRRPTAPGFSPATSGSAPTPMPSSPWCWPVEGGAPGMKGISLFLLPRSLDDGSTNRYRIIRLKDKLGTKSMASGEIRMDGAVAYLVGEQGRGFVQMADMVNNSRLSNGVRSAGMMRRAVAEAEFIAHERIAFGKRLEQMPLMQRQLDKLRVPAEQARTMVFQTAQTLMRSDAGQPDAYALLRILTPLIKFRACRDARKVTGDAMEVRGGCGYIEEWSDPRLVRDAHLGSIWEGTSNIVALDVIRAIKREGSLPVLQQYLHGLLDHARLVPGYRQALEDALARASTLADRAAQDGGEVLAARPPQLSTTAPRPSPWPGKPHRPDQTSACACRNWCCCTVCCRVIRWTMRLPCRRSGWSDCRRP
jgi:hypothetical protein